jgi:LmbE family N-acetylglucosaminyl deacetylase
VDPPNGQQIIQVQKKMMKMCFSRWNGDTLRILCLGAHSDDIEMGCGGTILRLLTEQDDVEVHWVVLGSSGKRDREAVKSAQKFLSGSKNRYVTVKNFRDGYFPFIGGKIKDYFEHLKERVSPDLIFSHYRYDLHQDHRIVSELTWNTFRNHLILEYEIVKYDGDMGFPNFFVPLGKSTIKKKVTYILETFKSQRKKDWFTEDAFLSVLRIRGIESKADDGYAEGFYCRKMII